MPMCGFPHIYTKPLKHKHDTSMYKENNYLASLSHKNMNTISIQKNSDISNLILEYPVSSPEENIVHQYIFASSPEQTHKRQENTNEQIYILFCI
jgi:hypothetical protein